jgi:hypothetical protein
MISTWETGEGFTEETSTFKDRKRDFTKQRGERKETTAASAAPTMDHRNATK